MVINTSIEKEKLIKNIFNAVLLIIVIVILSFLSKHYTKRTESYERIVLSEQCTISVNDKDIFKGNARYCSLVGHVKNGDRVKISFNIKENTIKNAVMVYLCKNVPIRVYIDGKQVYHHGEYTDNADIKGDYYIKIPITSEDIGKSVDVEQIICDNYYALISPEIYLINAQDCDKRFISQNIFNIFISVSMFVIPIIGLACIFIGFRLSRDNMALVWLLGLSISSSFWIATYFDIVDLVFNNVIIKYYVEYICMYLMLIFALLFTTERYKKDVKLVKKLKLLCCATGVCLVLIFVLQVFKIVFLADFNVLFYLLMVIMFYVFIRAETNQPGEVKEVNKVLIFALHILEVFSVVFIFKNVFDSNVVEELIEFMPIIICTSVFWCLVIYVQEYMNTFMMDTEKQSLTMLAYCDPLTMIPNRRACEKMIKEVNEDKENAYGVFVFDINGLKKVNDTYGHSSGDDLIINFAKALKSSFLSEDDFYGRFGGDEFIAVIKNPTDDKKNKIVSRLKKEVDKINDVSKKEYKLLFSNGFYVREENSDNNAWEIVAKADKQMYDDKNNI